MSQSASSDPAQHVVPTTTDISDIPPKPSIPVEEPALDDFGLPIRKKKKEPVNLPSDPVSDSPAVRSSPPIEPKLGTDVDAPVDVKVDTLAAEPTGKAATEAEEAQTHAAAQTVSTASKGNVTPPVTLTDAANNAPSEDTPKASLPVEASPSKASDKQPANQVSEWSHQQLAPQKEVIAEEEKEDIWQEMPAYAPFDIYNDAGKLVAKEEKGDTEVDMGYGNLGGAAKGYTRVQIDEDAQSATSMDDNTAYLFRERGTNVQDEDDDTRNADDQMATTKSLLTEGQRIAYVGLVRLAMIQMVKELENMEKTKGAKKVIEMATESMQMWAQQIIVRLFAHMEIESAEQLMIEQLAAHGVEPADLAPSLKSTAKVQNPRSGGSNAASIASPKLSTYSPRSTSPPLSPMHPLKSLTMGGIDSTLSLPSTAAPPPPYSPTKSEHGEEPDLSVKTPSELPDTPDIDVDIRWTVLCDFFLVLISSASYDSRSRRLLEVVGGYLDVPWQEISRFEKRVTDALEMQEEAAKENWNEDEHMENRQKKSRNRRLMLMGLATVGGGLVIGLSAGLLAPVIGAGLAAGFTTIGVAGTGTFLAGAGGAAIVTTTGILTGGTIAVRATGRRTGAVKTFEYRPLHNNKRVNLVVTVSGWMTGKVDDVRLPFSTVDPIMGDIYSVLWEPDMLRSMGDTINILATEALTQGLQQVLGSTILITLMAAMQLPLVLTKLSYLIDNPWSVSVARADAAGLILADSLIDRNLGSRPVTLVGFSLGSRLIMACLRELADRGHNDLIQNVYLFGTPTIAKKDDYLRAKTVVSGRFVNGYATNDWILGYLFRATGGGVMRVAGLAPVEVPGVENIDVTELVPGHMSYRQMMPRLLREVGWSVESDEFTEIEDPDPDNHDQRQRELIQELEEARKNLAEEPKKKRFAFWGKKKLAEKKAWETYDEKGGPLPGAGQATTEGGLEKQVLFDIDAIRKEVAMLSAEGIEVKELTTTLPPMRLALDTNGSAHKPDLGSTKSYNNGLPGTSSSQDVPSFRYDPQESPSTPKRTSEEDISMTFDSPYDTYNENSPHTRPNNTTVKTPPKPATPDTSVNFVSPRSSMGATSNQSKGSSHSPVQQSPLGQSSLEKNQTTPNTQTKGAVNDNPGHNAWADEEDDLHQQHEGEMSMTFE